MNSYKYWSVYEYADDDEAKRRRVYTFDNEPAAHALVEFLVQHDFIPPNIKVEEHETTA